MLAEGSGGVYSHPAGTTDGRDGDHSPPGRAWPTEVAGWRAVFPVPVHPARPVDFSLTHGQ